MVCIGTWVSAVRGTQTIAGGLRDGGAVEHLGGHDPDAHHAISGRSDGGLLQWELDWNYEFPA